MAILFIPDKNEQLNAFPAIQSYLSQRGITLEQWQANQPLALDADEEIILTAYQDALKPFMATHGYQTADVISVHPQTQNIEALKAKFLAEHTHSEDEVRFFVEGQGWFWFNLGDDEPVICVLCQAGDLLSVPAGYKHWFDLGDRPHVKAIRIFTDASGWIPHYTNSGIHERYQKVLSTP